ncbi:nucleolar complex-associated protein-domain-containing protein [Boletus edulis BED1]|uniref:Nucleolar complex-associated protein 3 n=1 Tax=Boletus edulis BED1 TaxID=1328754 RepID=A0AAD4C4A3_BOLED|nr:nucleolar complex-associated protein-domain-containing protein [Boletus edulis BED1]
MGPKSKKRAAPAAPPVNTTSCSSSDCHSPPVIQRPAKKKKVTPGRSSKRGLPKSGQSKPNAKGKAYERGYIAIPGAAPDHDVREDDLSEHDDALLDEFGNSIHFLAALDHQGIARSKKETKRLHKLHKPIRKPRADDVLSVDSHDEDSESLDTDIGDSDAETQSNYAMSDSEKRPPSPAELDSDTEMPYERVPRLHKVSGPETRRNIHGLPIKLSDGRIQASKKVTVVAAQDTNDKDTEGSVRSQSLPAVPSTVEDITTGARFGRLAVADVIENSSRKARIQGAKDQIASICQEIIADPENSLGLLRRLHTFSLETITTPSRSESIRNDVAIRKLAILSQLAVFKDIIPGYRIRTLTDKEKAEKVSQMVARTREWEQGLVLVYQTYLRALETELKAKSDLTDVALKCMCTLASHVTHFNFQANLMACIVARLSKKTWDESSDLCLNTLISIFQNDLTGVPSLEAVQLLNRMVKERHFNVHPEVLTCLLHLRLKSELGVRASHSTTDKEDKTKAYPKGKTANRKARGRSTEQPYLSKKAKKALKEKKEIEREVREAEAEVDKEERARMHTETLKLLFVLYFRILKNPRPTPLLPASLRGISKYAHLVNVDFFRDLMQVLKSLMTRESDEMDSDTRGSRSLNQNTDIQHRLLCIVTAFELLSGQGEALNIDPSDFVDHLYAIILPISELLQMDESSPSSGSRRNPQPTIAAMLFRALTIVFSPRTAGNTLPWRSAAFSKRLLIASLNWPPAVALRALDFVGNLVMKEPKLEVLLSTDDRHADGVYLPEVDDPQLSYPFGTSFFELLQLQQRHYDSRIRESAHRLSSYTRT